MSTCPWKRVCEPLWELLLRLDVDASSISQECRDDGPCHGVFDNIMLVTAHINVDNAYLVHEFLTALYGGQLPIDSAGGTIKQIFSQRPFGCPEIDVEIRQPCRVRSCGYWTNHAWTRNCILFYRIDQGRDSLDLKELTFLLDQTSTELRKRTNLILAEMRRWALHNKAEQLEIPTVMEPAVVGDRCCVCGNKIDKGSVTKGGFQYCGRACVEHKPPLDFRIEQEFKLPVDRVLRICIDSFAARRPMCHALNVTTKQLEDLCGRHAIEISPA